MFQAKTQVELPQSRQYLHNNTHGPQAYAVGEIYDFTQTAAAPILPSHSNLCTGSLRHWLHLRIGKQLPFAL